jgi:cytochrome c-type biogenesis protein CcmF
VSQFGQNTEAVGTPAIDSGLEDDVYLTVDALPAQAGGPVTIGVTVQPLVMWLWGGGFLLVLGSALAAVPGRRRRPTDPVSAPVPAAAAGDGSRGSGDAEGPSAVVVSDVGGAVEADESLAAAEPGADEHVAEPVPAGSP